jgi:hypothetical protein
MTTPPILIHERAKQLEGNRVNERMMETPAVVV